MSAGLTLENRLEISLRCGKTYNFRTSARSHALLRMAWNWCLPVRHWQAVTTANSQVVLHTVLALVCKHVREQVHDEGGGGGGTEETGRE